MTLQERMIAVYLRQAKLPPEEKDKLRLFLGLLLETFEEDQGPLRAVEDAGPYGQDRTGQDRTGQDRTGHPRRRRRLLPLAAG